MQDAKTHTWLVSYAQGHFVPACVVVSVWFPIVRYTLEKILCLNLQSKRYFRACQAFTTASKVFKFAGNLPRKMAFKIPDLIERKTVSYVAMNSQFETLFPTFFSCFDCFPSYASNELLLTE